MRELKYYMFLSVNFSFARWNVVAYYSVLSIDKLVSTASVSLLVLSAVNNGFEFVGSNQRR
jgi:hypothetical protein